MARPNSRHGADPAAVMATVRDVLGLTPLPDPEPSPLDALPIDLLADLDKTRAVIASLPGR